MKRQFSVWLVVMLMLSMLVQPVGLAGGFKSPGNDLTPGTISIGASPATVDPNKPVIVFVQGLTNDSTVWYQNNNMYNLAVQAGYQTAFVELFDSGGTPQSYWDNGALLADQLQQISDFFGGKQLTIVAYSKGGVDTQVALIHEGKYDLVSNVITLGSPHYGSELADLANSSSLGWLASLIGQNSPGTQSLQTANMNYFRSITDNRIERTFNNYYTLAGNRTGPIFSSYWFGSGFVNGPSDGVVSVASATLPYAPMLAVGNWNHGEVNIGSNVFNIFRPQLTMTGFRVASMQEAARMSQTQDEELNVLVRGGEQFGEASETFYVEEEADAIVINWLSATDHDTIDLLAPGENVVETLQIDSVADDTMFFEGAYHHVIELDDPLPGEWTVATTSEEATAYAMLVTFDSELNSQLHVEHSEDLREVTVEQEFPANENAARRAQSHVSLDYDVTFTPGEGRASNEFGQSIRERNSERGNRGNRGNQARIPELGEGLYTMTADVEGQSAAGSRFERTLIQSVFIDEEGNAY